MLGGKWTTYRKMGEDMIDEAEKTFGWKKTSTHTRNLKIHGYLENNNFDNPLFYYGSDYPFLKQEIEKAPGGWISEKFPLHKAQIKWAVENEMAETVDDILSRRTRSLLLDAREALRIAPMVAEELASLKGKGEEWLENQVEAFREITRNYILK